MKTKFKPDRTVSGGMKSLDELIKQEFIYHRGKVLHRGWFTSWKLQYAIRQLEIGYITKAIRLTNREYYEGTAEYLREKYQEDIDVYKRQATN